MRTLTIFFVLANVASVAVAQWFQQNSGTIANLNLVDFTDARTGWVIVTTF